ncbi:MAG TPA: multicopper oxidase domain-containing protein [Dermatophilaceae bacterium]|nr:multicopper oxidase domain-containing protein [Dermatophilaceae bacterium]
MRDYPTVGWLVLAVVVALVHRQVPESRWLMVHAVTLGALTHAVLVWSTHFTQALLKTAESIDPRARQQQRLWLLLAGTVLVVVGVPSGRWPLTVAGAALVVAAVGWHAWALGTRLRRALPGRFRITLRYYLAAAAAVPVGATLGVLLARGPDDTAHGRLLVAHTTVMALGWIGLTATGTLVTLWPTMLRTRIDSRAEALARKALWPLTLGVIGTVVAALVGSRPAVAAGLSLYAAGLAWWGRALLAPARQAPPREFATWSVAAALAWLPAGVLWVAGSVIVRDSWAEIGDAYGHATTAIVVGFGAQLVEGALSYLVPSVLGGGPSAVREATARLGRWGAARIVLTNAGLVGSLLPVPGAVRVVLTLVVLGSLAAFLPLLVLGVRDGVRAGRVVPDAAAGTSRPPVRPQGIPSGQLVAAATTLTLAVALGVLVDPVAAGAPTSTLGIGAGQPATVAATGRSTTVRVDIAGMHYSPARIEVPYGDRLVIELANDDPGQVHDLVLETGARTPRLRPGERATLDAGVVGADLQGWCSIVGHRQMGMILDVVVAGAPRAAAAPSGHDGHPAPAGVSASAGDPAYPRIALSDNATAITGPVDPVLPPLTESRTHVLTLRAQEVELEVAPGVWQRRWTFGGRVPGPALHGRVGDVFEVTLVNDGTQGHSIDFHAGALAPDRPMRTIAPGESLVYRFTATRAGIWMYHCSTMPMSVHIAAGMFGAVVIEPPGLPALDRSYLLVQSEVYVGESTARGSAVDVDATRVAAEHTDAVTFNGIANQYAAQPLPARVGERVRIWVLDAGPSRATSFHVVGGQFDVVYKEGAWLLGDPAQGGPAVGTGSQALDLAPAQGGFVELVLPEAGHYSVVSHVMVDAERGARGILAVSP